MGLGSAGFSCRFRASQGRWELAEAPGAAEVGAQGVGGGTGLPEGGARAGVSGDGQAGQSRAAHPSRAGHRMTDLCFHRAHAANRGKTTSQQRNKLIPNMRQQEKCALNTGHNRGASVPGTSVCAGQSGI